MIACGLFLVKQFENFGKSIRMPKGNHYRLVVAIQYQLGIIYIRFIGTHKDYDKTDVVTI